MIKCSDCNKEFSNKLNLKRHRHRIHNPDYKPPSPKKCDICGVFRSNLRQHYIFNHSTEQKHIEEKEKKRLTCIKHYQENKEQYLEKHRKWGKNNPDKLKIARKKWRDANKDYVKVKTQEYASKPVECKICGKVYTRNYLRRHIKVCLNGNTKPRMSKTHIPVKKVSEVDKLREQIRKAEQRKSIKKNLTIKSNVILEW